MNEYAWYFEVFDYKDVNHPYKVKSGKFNEFIVHNEFNSENYLFYNQKEWWRERPILTNVKDCYLYSNFIIYVKNWAFNNKFIPNDCYCSQKHYKFFIYKGDECFYEEESYREIPFDQFINLGLKIKGNAPNFNQYKKMRHKRHSTKGGKRNCYKSNYAKNIGLIDDYSREYPSLRKYRSKLTDNFYTITEWDLSSKKHSTGWKSTKKKYQWERD